jgi:hypothetical protein
MFMAECDIPEEPTKLIVTSYERSGIDMPLIIAALDRDSVILVKGVPQRRNDTIVYDLAQTLGLAESLELQAGFAEFHGHRRRVGNYFMSVNTRLPYQYIAPHSEGTSHSGMQLAAFYCCENTTDGGETILFNVASDSDAWPRLREKVLRVRAISEQLSSDELARASALYGIRLPSDMLQDLDEVISDVPCKIPGIALVEALVRPVRTRSSILARNLYACWDSVGSIDHELAHLYVQLLKRWGLLKEPPEGLENLQMDNAAPRRIWRSGVDYSQIFKAKITYKLRPRDLIICNNMTWTHSATNWSPESGTRDIAAAFA